MLFVTKNVDSHVYLARINAKLDVFTQNVINLASKTVIWKNVTEDAQKN
jgi:hypothetical protein